MKVAVTVPALPSVTVTSPIDGADERVVVGDRARALAVGDRRVDGRRQVDEEGLVGLVERVAVDGDADGLARLAGGEGQRADALRVVGRLHRRRRRPSRRRRVTVLALGAASVTVKLAVVVPLLPSATVTSPIDMPGGPSSSVIVPAPLASASVALAGLERPTVKRLVGLVERVAVDRDGDRLAGLAGGEGERAAGLGVVGGLRRGAVGGRVVDRDRLAARGREADGEGGVRGAGVALGDGSRRRSMR